MGGYLYLVAVCPTCEVAIGDQWCSEHGPGEKEIVTAKTEFTDEEIQQISRILHVDPHGYLERWTALHATRAVLQMAFMVEEADRAS